MARFTRAIVLVILRCLTRSVLHERISDSTIFEDALVLGRNVAIVLVLVVRRLRCGVEQVVDAQDSVRHAATVTTATAGRITSPSCLASASYDSLPRFRLLFLDQDLPSKLGKIAFLPRVIWVACLLLLLGLLPWKSLH